jgi:hypothetical protein
MAGRNKKGKGMSWFIRFTRFASAHIVYSQEKQNSCGMASIMMVNFKMKKGLMLAGMAAGSAVSVVPVIGGQVGQSLSKAAVNAAVKTEQEVYQEYTKVTGSPYDGSSYSDATHFPKVLGNLGLGQWELVQLGTGLAKAIKDTTDAGAPCIGHVVWDSGGAHFVVIDENHLGYGCVNDPWDGNVHVTRMSDGKEIRYDASDCVGWTIGGKKNDYPTGSTGRFSGWLVRRK